MEGTIKVLKDGYGFIESSETSNDTFFHASSLTNTEFSALKVGDKLNFEIGDGNNGKKQAINVETA